MTEQQQPKEQIETKTKITAVLETLNVHPTVQAELALLAAESVAYVKMPENGLFVFITQLTTYQLRAFVNSAIINNERVHRAKQEDKPKALKEERLIHQILVDAWKSGKVQRLEDLVYLPRERAPKQKEATPLLSILEGLPAAAQAGFELKRVIARAKALEEKNRSLTEEVASLKKEELPIIEGVATEE